MRQYSYFQAIFMSFYSRELYRDVAKNWSTGVVLYLLLLLSLCWSALMFEIQPSINRAVSVLGQSVVPQLPTAVTIKNGIATTPENHPYLVRDPNSKKVVLIVDTTGKNLTLDQAKVNVLITKDSFIYKNDNGMIQIRKFPQTLNMNIQSDKMKDKIISIAGLLWIVLLPILILFSLLFRLAQSIVYAVIGKPLALIMKISMTYSELLKIAIVAATPSIMLGTLADLIQGAAANKWYLYFILSMIYLTFGIWANKKPSGNTL